MNLEPLAVTEACWEIMAGWGGVLYMNGAWQALMQLSGVLVQRCDFPSLRHHRD